MIDDTSTVTPQRTPSEAEKIGQKADQKRGSPQERTKDPKDTGPKWPGGGPKGENEKKP